MLLGEALQVKFTLRFSTSQVLAAAQEGQSILGK